MHLLVFIAVISLLSCGQNSSNGKKEALKDSTTKAAVDTAKIKSVAKNEMPAYISPDEEAVNDALKARYGAKWHVLNDKEAKWMKDAFDYFIVPKRKEDPDYPYIARGDFNADGKADTAAVVTDSLNSNYQIAILLGPDKVQFWKEDVLGNAAISMIPGSTIEGMDGEKTKKVKLKGDGISVEYFEQASFVLYWSGSAFKRIQTGD